MNRKKELLIINHLRKNARESLTNISRLTRIPISTIYERLRSSEGNLIIKHTSLVNFPRLGYNARAKLMLKAAKEKKGEMRSYLHKHENVNSLYKINNGYDLLAECIFRDMKQMEDFIESLEERFSLEKKEVFYIIEDIKREGFLSESPFLS